MTIQKNYHVYLSYGENTLDFVELLATRLKADSKLSFWFEPWHSIPGVPSQEQMEEALWNAQSCAVFLSKLDKIQGWQNEQMRVAIQTRVDDNPNYRIIPVLLSDMTQRDLPSFLRRYQPIKFRNINDNQAFKQLVSGILGIPPIKLEEHFKLEREKMQLSPPPSQVFSNGHALVIGVAHYPLVNTLPETVLNDARDVYNLLINPSACGYPKDNVTLMLDHEATSDGIRSALSQLASVTSGNETVVIYFSGHGAYKSALTDQQYILPYNCQPNDLTSTAIAGDEVTKMLNAIRAERLLVVLDCCHSGGVGDPKTLSDSLGKGFTEEYYQILSQGKGRVVMASSRPNEVSWALHEMQNSLFTHYFLEAFTGHAKTLNDGYVRVFDVFRHVAENVPTKAKEYNITQHPIFKATAMESDFPIALLTPN